MATIYTTSDYSIFKRLEGNREVKQKRINEISKSVSEVGWITNPIIVNENMEVIDGQGRLEVLERLNLPVDYVIHVGAGLKECQEINLHTTSWSSEEMIKSFAEVGHDGCGKLKKLMDEFNIPASTAIVPLGIQRSCLKKQAKNITISDESYMEAREFFIWYKTIETIVKNLPGRMASKIFALVYCFHHNVDMDELSSVLQKIDDAKFNATSQEDIIKSIQQAYNYNKKLRKNRIYIYESYRKGE